jgi:hypothetical protein
MLMAGSARANPPGPLPVRQRMEGRRKGMTAVAPRGRCSGPAVLCTYSGEGMLSHVGRVRFHSTHCGYLTVERQPIGRLGEAKMIMVTCDGDEIYATYTGQRLDGPKYLVSMRITGGSGEYSEVTGSLVAIITVDSATSDVSIRGWGWMAR